VVDAHIHFWDPDQLDYPWLHTEPSLHTRFVPDMLEPRGVEVEGFVFVQAECSPHQAAAEVAWLHDLVDAGAPVLGVVARASLEDGPRCTPTLARYAEDPLVVGVRRLIQDEPAGFALQGAFVDAVRLLPEHGLTLDLCIRSHQLAEMSRLVEMCPDTTFVLDHLGKPRIEPAGPDRWADDLARLARLPQVWCKLSGLVSEAEASHRSPDVLLPYLHHALDVFGPQRCLFGSDWPVSSLVVEYQAWYEVVLEACRDLSPAQRDQVMNGGARQVYRLAGHEGG
jgi:L-fuconolactonase